MTEANLLLLSVEAQKKCKANPLALRNFRFCPSFFFLVTNWISIIILVLSFSDYSFRVWLQNWKKKHKTKWCSFSHGICNVIVVRAITGGVSNVYYAIALWIQLCTAMDLIKKYIVEVQKPLTHTYIQPPICLTVNLFFPPAKTIYGQTVTPLPNDQILTRSRSSPAFTCQLS